MWKEVTMDNGITSNSLSMFAATANSGQRFGSRSGANWFEAFATAWGTALDNQASKIEIKADELNGGDDRPSTITLLTAEAQRMSFLSNSSHTALDSVSKALETMARKG
jgi:hypothetical protein